MPTLPHQRSESGWIERNWWSRTPLTTPYEECLWAVIEADLPEISGYTGETLRGMAEDVAREFYHEGEDWQAAFAGFLAAREMGVENISPVPEETNSTVDLRNPSEPLRIPA